MRDIITNTAKQLLLTTQQCFVSMVAVLILYLPILPCSAQDIQKSFNNYQQNTLQEKVFVHTDKNTYLPGEIIWLKVYCVDANTNKPLNLSKVVYVEILDKNHNPVMQEKISIDNGTGSGSIYVPVTLINGVYLFRAYTNWMKNFDPDNYFEKRITLINPLMPANLEVKTLPKPFDVQFFPEGGNLVGGITSKVAFKCINRYGKGVQVSGAVVGKQNDTVARFSSLKFGMGSFLFKPVAGVKYRAIIKISNEAPIIEKLPDVMNQGYVMRLLDDGSGRLDVMVNSMSNPNAPVYLFAHTRQSVKLAEMATLSKGTAHFKISKSLLDEGICHITVFDNLQKPVCERLFFKRPARRLVIDAALNQTTYKLREKVSIDILAKEQSDKPANADMSMAVYRIDSLQLADPGDIFNYLWLTSELQGQIETPDYYFQADNAETDVAADNLMLTQGWRRFKWSQVMENNAAGFTYIPEYDGHIINAHITNTVTNTPAKGIVTYLSIPGKRVQLFTSKSDSSGNLLFNTRQIYGANELVLQTNTLIDSIYRIDLSIPFSGQYSKTALPDFTITAECLQLLKEHSIGAQALNVYHGVDVKQLNYPLIDSTAFYGKTFKKYKLDDFTRFTTLEEDLREYVKETYVTYAKSRFSIKVMTENGFLNGGNPVVIFDGVPVFNIDKVMRIDPLKIRKLEIKPNRYLYGFATFEGILNLTSYKADLTDIEIDPKALVIDYEGLQLQREFYSPVYDTETRVASRVPDFRNVLYWTPRIDKMGKNAVSFYTADQVGQYLGVIQCITANGNAASRYITFVVK